MAAETITIRLPEELLARVRELAVADRRSVSAMIALLLERAVEEKK